MVLENLKRPPSPGSRIFVGLSGGRDSLALLHLINKKILNSDKDSPWRGSEVKAIHINHKLQTLSDHFETFSKEVCKNLGIHIEIKSLNIHSGTIRKYGLEAAARQGRFAAFQNILTNDNDVLALGHHLDDQIETVFLQWMRGAGMEGLTGMLILDKKLLNGRLLNVWRPMLETTRVEISKYLKSNNLKWVEDPTNDDLEHDRNLLRHRVMPMLKLIRSGAPSAMGRSVKHLQSARLLLEKMTNSALEVCEIKKHSKCSRIKSLSKYSLLQLDDQLISRVLRAWLIKMGLSVPPTKRLQEFVRQLRKSSKKTGSLIEVNGENGYLIVSDINELTLKIK
ncbi:MAG: tRNA lysidine(34) synthetase TilS [Betaproteobacteria bacterium TMED41]|nr:MAG: tRNA lysidine(34) synthetase TilS [Betaproteobacteria bacterium TMED41]